MSKRKNFDISNYEKETNIFDFGKMEANELSRYEDSNQQYALDKLGYSIAQNLIKSGGDININFIQNSSYEKIFTTAKDASERLGISENRIREDINKGCFPYIHGCNAKLFYFKDAECYYHSIAEYEDFKGENV